MQRAAVDIAPVATERAPDAPNPGCGSRSLHYTVSCELSAGHAGTHRGTHDGNPVRWATRDEGKGATCSARGVYGNLTCDLPAGHRGSHLANSGNSSVQWTLRDAPSAGATDDPATKGPAEDEIRAECAALAELLVAKNRAYGNAALEPVRIMSKASPVEQLLVRIDDKLSRLVRGEAAGEDVEADLLGYFVLLRIARRMAAAKGGA